MNEVAILICTYRGERFLERQLDTFLSQTHRHWKIFVSDDRSDDSTIQILERYQRRLGERRMVIFRGPGKGFSANFLSLIERVDLNFVAYAFADQDDEWDCLKLERSLTSLSKVTIGTPAIYGSRSELIDEDGNRLGFSRVCRKPPGFANALVQNMVSGNTMVLNTDAMQLIKNAGTNVEVSAHDWWAYLLVTGSGGEFIYDEYPTVRYRQHNNNLYGTNVFWKGKWARVCGLFAGDFRDWNEMNVSALHDRIQHLDEESRHRLDLFQRARTSAGLGRLAYLAQAGVYRQTLEGQLGLIVGALTGRI